MLITSPAAYKNGRWLTKFYTIMFGLAALFLLSDMLKGITNTYRWMIQAIVFFYFLWTFLTSDRREKFRIEKALRSLTQGKKASIILGKEKMELTEDSLNLNIEGCQSTMQMHRVTEIVEYPEHVSIQLAVGTVIVPRKKVERGDLQEFVNALKSRGVQSSVFTDEKRDRIQPAIYVFISAAVSFIPALLGYSTYSSVTLERFAKCLGESGIESLNLCFSVLRLDEILLLCATPVFVFLLIASLILFYKNSKRAGSKKSE